MIKRLPPEKEMYRALASRDSAYNGIFFAAIKTTGIFCLPSCPARKPNPENVEYYPSARESLAHGFRPCKRCRPLAPPGETPDEIQALITDLDRDPTVRLRDRDLRERGLEPSRVRRWFKKHHGMTFQAYQRARRLNVALEDLASGESVTQSAFGAGFESISGFQDAIKKLTGKPANRSRDTPVVHLSRILTPLGPMILGSTDEGVCLLEFTDRRMLETQLLRLVKRLGCVYAPGQTEPGRQMEQELDQYFQRRLKQFKTPLLLPGTDFQQRVWDALRTIPYGTTRSYGEQAEYIESPKAVRAVAKANGDNRISIVIPCHRVVGSDGKLTGYGGGLWRKKWLLEHERGLKDS